MARQYTLVVKADYTHRRKRCDNCHSHCTIENHERSVFPCGLVLDANNHTIRECRNTAA